MVVYDSGDSDALMNTLQANLKGAGEVFGRLSKGSSHLVDTVNSGMLKGAAYTAGREMFVMYIDPMVQKLNEAVGDMQNDLNAYRASDGEIRAIDNHIDGEDVKRKLDNTNHMIDVVQQKIKDQKRTLSMLVTPSNEIGASSDNYKIRDGMNSSIDKLNKQLSKLESLKADYDEEIVALNTFTNDTASLFKDSAQVFKDAMRGVKVINSTRANADGSIVFPPGADMSWAAALRKDKLSTPVDKRDPSTLPDSYRAKIKDIQNDPTITDSTEKAKRIRKVYEEWLHSLAPDAFDDYAKARREYDKKKAEWEKNHPHQKYAIGPDDDPDVLAADKKLTKVLHSTHVDIRKVARGLGDDVARISGADDLGEFYGMVQTTQPLDLKSQKTNGENYSIWSRGWDGNPTEKNGGPSPDFLGNYLYGYYGDQVGIGTDMLKAGAGIQQMVHDNGFHIKGDKDNIFKDWGDNPGDQQAIQKGMDDYERQKEKEQSEGSY
ncbi:polymorphic toxin type 44 domain-containing protein [Bifidobacterium sp. ESL0769]|uniref:polymorphic toxin type 44 domain-containing protein n=1 Tax=Bifidobacterium sp. ESL0769 TaxID=2983229 RepID=UPI0023F8C766|nr:polymorphic toxin type 44 domain-containing protein [Bifidobacterium sp. ESL0769]WEV67882.1 polymorphic toxin type 44 domain-containing protein [Bifidobacterium sp. ESL0769]